MDLQKNEMVVKDVILVAQGEMALEEFLKQVHFETICYSEVTYCCMCLYAAFECVCVCVCVYSYNMYVSFFQSVAACLVCAFVCVQGPCVCVCLCLPCFLVLLPAYIYTVHIICVHLPACQ